MFPISKNRTHGLGMSYKDGQDEMLETQGKRKVGEKKEAGMSKSGEDDGGREGVDKEWREGKIEAILDSLGREGDISRS